MRIVAWNCNMALERKIEALLALDPDIAVISECAEPGRLRLRSKRDWLESDPVWVGRNPHKGLAVFTFHGYAARLAASYHPSLRYIAPVHVCGRTSCNLLAVWAQNASAGGIRKHQLGPLRRALSRYKAFLAEAPAVVAGDFNNNTIWDKPGWRINHSTKVRILEESFGLVSAYHTVRGEAHGLEREPTLYWRDRRKDGPTYHIDYVFLPSLWIEKVRDLSIGGFETWCGSGLSDHVPVVVDVEV
ncbi:MAG: endonuclease/exonuclease/phosphatase family protein [Alphaproteobacteria bacterium]|nr:endonuclease/exonuclease/phosphatase family protein [Alphaproteobacteria bacterium]MBV8407290.1 endonuclease/exonuclease/phosphatase family protein [Alphaproteobacteria bacterium]